MWAQRKKIKIDEKKYETTPHEIRRRYILACRPRLGSSYEATVEADTLEDEEGVAHPVPGIEKLKRLHKSDVKAQFRISNERTLYHYTHNVCNRPEIRRWYDDPTIKQTYKDDVDRLYRLLLGKIERHHPDYIMTVLVDIVYKIHEVQFKPEKFLQSEMNIKTYLENWNLVWGLLGESGITTLTQLKTFLRFELKG